MCRLYSEMRAFVRHMLALQDLIVMPLRESSLIDASVFVAFDPVVAFALDACRALAGACDVVSFFTELVDRFDVLAAYSSTVWRAVKLIDDSLEQNKPFKEFITKQCGCGELVKCDVKSMFLEPLHCLEIFQRALVDLANESLRPVLAAIEQQLHARDDARSQELGRHVLAHYQTIIDGAPDLLKDGRELMCEGPLKLSKDDATSDVYVFMLNDVMLVCTKKRNKYKLREELNLENALMLPHDALSFTIKASLQSDRERVVKRTFSCSQHDADMWRIGWDRRAAPLDAAAQQQRMQALESTIKRKDDEIMLLKQHLAQYEKLVKTLQDQYAALLAERSEPEQLKPPRTESEKGKRNSYESEKPKRRGSDAPKRHSEEDKPKAESFDDDLKKKKSRLRRHSSDALKLPMRERSNAFDEADEVFKLEATPE